MANYIFLVRASDPRRKDLTLAQQVLAILVALRARGLSPKDRVVVVAEYGSSYSFPWRQRQFVRWLRDDWQGGVFTLLTAHPTRLTRRPEELGELLGFIRERGGLWESLGVRGHEDRLVDPMRVEGNLEEQLVMYQTGNEGGSMHLRATRLTTRVFAADDVMAEMPQVKTISDALRQLCQVRGCSSILLVVRVSPRKGSNNKAGDRDGEPGPYDSSVDYQTRFLRMFCPAGIDVKELAGQGVSAYTHDWHEDIITRLGEEDLRGQKCLVLSWTLDRMTRQPAGLDILRSVEGHVFVPLVWDMPAHVTTDPLEALGIPDALESSQAASYRDAVTSQFRANDEDSVRIPVVFPVALANAQSPDLQQLLNEHIERAHSAARVSYGGFNYGLLDVPEELDALNEKSKLLSTDTSRQYLSKELQLPLANMEMQTLDNVLCPCERHNEALHDEACRCDCLFCQNARTCGCELGACECKVLCDCSCNRCHRQRICATDGCTNPAPLYNRQGKHCFQCSNRRKKELQAARKAAPQPYRKCAKPDCNNSAPKGGQFGLSCSSACKLFNAAAKKKAKKDKGDA